jgi:recombinational DNA repair ATPase RecF
MSIILKSLHLENFTVFPEATFTFGKNLNVIIGKNGTGKTHVLKAAYTAIAVSAARSKDVRARRISNWPWRTSCKAYSGPIVWEAWSGANRKFASAA